MKLAIIIDLHSVVSGSNPERSTRLNENMKAKILFTEKSLSLILEALHIDLKNTGIKKNKIKGFYKNIIIVEK